MLEFLDAAPIPSVENGMSFLEAFQQMDTWMQVFWVCAVVGSIIFIIQMVLTPWI